LPDYFIPLDYGCDGAKSQPYFVTFGLFADIRSLKITGETRANLPREACRHLAQMGGGQQKM
jgi:hypothetical protein